MHVSGISFSASACMHFCLSMSEFVCMYACVSACMSTHTFVCQFYMVKLQTTPKGGFRLQIVMSLLIMNMMLFFNKCHSNACHEYGAIFQ